MVRQTSDLSPEYLRKAIRASFLGELNREPTEEEMNYYLEKAGNPDTFSDGVERVGWNRYREIRLDGRGSADPKLGDMPALYQPEEHQDAPKPPSSYTFENELFSRLDRIIDLLDRTTSLLRK